LRSSPRWEIELRIPDKRAGYLLRTWKETQSIHQPVSASFVLTSDVSRVIQGQVREVSPSSNVDDKENENVVRVRIKLSEEAFAELGRARPGRV